MMRRRGARRNVRVRKLENDRHAGFDRLARGMCGNKSPTVHRAQRCGEKWFRCERPAHRVELPRRLAIAEDRERAPENTVLAATPRSFHFFRRLRLSRYGPARL